MTPASDLKPLADSAKSLLEDPAFCAAILALRKQWFGELMIGSDKEAPELIGKLRALEEIPQHLQVLINDYKMAAARSK